MTTLQDPVSGLYVIYWWLACDVINNLSWKLLSDTFIFSRVSWIKPPYKLRAGTKHLPVVTDVWLSWQQSRVSRFWLTKIKSAHFVPQARDRQVGVLKFTPTWRLHSRLYQISSETVLDNFITQYTICLKNFPSDLFSLYLPTDSKSPPIVILRNRSSDTHANREFNEETISALYKSAPRFHKFTQIWLQ